MKDRTVDVATMFLNAPTNPPVGAIKLLRAPIRFQQWNGVSWADVLLDITAGGTGGSSAAAARTALGIGTMGVQASNAIAVTGGTITGLTGLTMTGSVLFTTDNTYDVGSFAVQVRKGYFKDALVIPVGVDKFATS